MSNFEALNEARENIKAWRGVRVVDGDALEMRFGESQRGFSLNTQPLISL
ncbi:MAG: hypothetical protein HC785_16570 [Calothrix sp. CSU_2_0]|nr:hypothetical protein [Calothrix sp. CSU_2_0]